MPPFLKWQPLLHSAQHGDLILAPGEDGRFDVRAVATLSSPLLQRVAIDRLTLGGHRFEKVGA